MTENNLLTLREISEQLGVNYRTIIDYKNHFRRFIRLEYDGQSMKYPEKYIDFFRMVMVLKEEGYQNSVIKMIMTGEIGLPGQKHLEDWISEWKDGGDHPTLDGYTHPQMDGGVHPSSDGCTHPSSDGGTHPSSDGGTHPQTDESIHPELLSYVQNLVSENTSNIEAAQSQHVAQINSALTKLYQALIELQQATTSINQRLARLESELNGQAGEEPEFSQLDLEELQIGSNPPEPIKYEHADLEFVKASIQNGKPNKDAVLQWALAEKEKDPGVSYGHLAQVLDQAGVPTLSGRTGWHRTTLRNLVIKHSG